MSLTISRRLIIVIAVMSLILATLLPIQVEAKVGNQQNKALLIGISSYGPACSYGDLEYCHKDAMDLFNVLVDQYDWKPSDIRILLNESATEENIIDGIQWLKKSCRKTDSTAIFYFSGHGDFFADVQAIPNRDEPRDQSLVPYDGDSSTGENYIFDDSLKGYFSDFNSDETILILDSCYSGGIIGELGYEGNMILSSCRANEMCSEGGIGNNWVENGVYTYCILDALRGAGDSNNDGLVSLEEAASYAEIHVRDITPNVHPVTYDGIEGETYL